MRVLIFFDLPVKNKNQRKAATQFRNALIKKGFVMMQYSVYFRVVRGMTSARTQIKSLRSIVPSKGNIRAVVMTEKQFDNMEIMCGSCSRQEEVVKPVQLSLF